jgi:hypothetical protein
VEVALGKALGGTIDASVWVDRPVVTLLRTSDGRSNADGLLEGKEEEKEPSKGKPLQVTLHLKDGKIVAHALPAAGRPATAPDVVDGITVEAGLGADGSMRLAASALARGAKAGGGDVPITASATLDAAGAGPASLSVPSLDLARLSNLMGATTGIERLAARSTRREVGRSAGVGVGHDAHCGHEPPVTQGRGTVTLALGRLTASPTVVDGRARSTWRWCCAGCPRRGSRTRTSRLTEPEMSVRGRWCGQNGDLAFGDATNPVRITGGSCRARLGLDDGDGERSRHGGRPRALHAHAVAHARPPG